MHKPKSEFLTAILVNIERTVIKIRKIQITTQIKHA